MRNEEKYRTTADRVAAYRAYRAYLLKEKGVEFKGIDPEEFSDWLIAEAKSIEPRKCPYCGKCEIVHESGGSQTHNMMCINCHARGPVCDTKDEAIARWNAVSVKVYGVG